MWRSAFPSGAGLKYWPADKNLWCNFCNIPCHTISIGSIDSASDTIKQHHFFLLFILHPSRIIFCTTHRILFRLAQKWIKVNCNFLEFFIHSSWEYSNSSPISIAINEMNLSLSLSNNFCFEYSLSMFIDIFSNIYSGELYSACCFNNDISLYIDFDTLLCSFCTSVP